MCEKYGSSPFIGGGEPTLHPKFDTILLDAIVAAKKINNNLTIGIITNGSITQRALKIAALAKADVIWGRLSRDQYHDPISDEAVAAFDTLDHNSGVHDTSQGGSCEPLPHGRGKELLGWDDDDYCEDNRGEAECPCGDHIIQPNGDIYQCGCDDAPRVGNVRDGVEHFIVGCHKSQEFIEACIEHDCDYLLY
jgi:MoaA/NifB/PqqE/SkfB family radical SAM enzyme